MLHVALIKITTLGIFHWQTFLPSLVRNRSAVSEVEEDTRRTEHHGLMSIFYFLKKGKCIEEMDT
jgi:hypothetical protein